MRATVYFLGAISLILGAEALQIFSLPVSKIEPPAHAQRAPSQLRRPRVIQRRQFSTPLINQFPLYVVDITLGTPPQSLRVHLDTGSSDLVVQTDASDLCTTDPASCSDGGTYNANASSTYEYYSSDLFIAYLSGEFASGDYANDTFTIGGASLDGYYFGIMYETTVTDSILGIGLVENEFGAGLSPPRTYPNLPVSLANAGVIPSAAFSLYLNDLQDISGGTILFGGIDTEKYCGPLGRLPMVPTPGFESLGILEYTVDTTGVSGTRNGVPVVFPAGTASYGPALLDSGTSINILPDALTNEIFAFVGAIFQPGDILAKVPCNITSEDIVFQFKFATVAINVPISQLVLVTFPDPDGLCFFGITPNSEFGTNSVILGDTFLSSAYAVFDVDNKNIYLAQAKFGAVGENILQIQAGVNGVPQQDGICDAAPTTTTTTTTTTITTTTTTTTTTSRTTSTTTSTMTSTTGSSTTTSSTLTTTTPTTSTTSTISTTTSTGGTAVVSADPRSTTTGNMGSGGKPVTTAPPRCHRDGCYKVLARGKVAGVDFCSEFKASGKACSTPHQVASACHGGESRIASACSCLPTPPSYYARR